jgi:UDP-N-acetylglucosamine acyltransferase
MHRALYRKGLTLAAGIAEIAAMRGTSPETDADVDLMLGFLGDASRGIVR